MLIWQEYPATMKTIVLVSETLKPCRCTVGVMENTWTMQTSLTVVYSGSS